MKRDKETSANTFTQGINDDVDPHAMEATAYLDAENIESAYGSVGSAVVTARGNEEVPFALGGNNKCIGSIENRQGGGFIYFVTNLLGTSHQILWYKDGVVTLVMDKSFLNFNVNRYVHSAKIIDGKLLYFTDGTDFGSGIVGNPPHVVNLERALLGKILQHRLLFSEAAFLVGATYTLTIRNAVTDAIVSGPTLIHTVGAGPPAKDVTVANLVLAFAGQGVTATFPYNTASNPAPYLDLTMGVNDRIIVVAGSVVSVPINYYHRSIDEQAISLIKPYPRIAPSPIYVQTSAVPRANLYGNSYQFRCRYVFVDDEKSAWGPASYVPTNFVPSDAGIYQSYIEPRETYNQISILFFTNLTNTEYGRSIIKGYEIAVKTSLEGVWRLVDYVNLHEVYLDYQYSFQNTGTYPAVPSDENAAADVQALKLYDFVPRITLGLEGIYDNRGNTILSLGGGLFDFDLIAVIADVTYTTDSQVGPPINLQDSNGKCLKSGGIYDVGVVYKDLYGRCSSVVKLGTVRIPFAQQPTGGFPAPNITIHFLDVTFLTDPPPSWATDYHVCITKNKNQAIYFQTPARDVDYWYYHELEDKLVAVAFGDPLAEYVSFNIVLNDLGETPLSTYIFELLAENEKIFLPEPMDRIQVLSINVGFSLPAAPFAEVANLEDYNYEIAGYRVDAGATADVLNVLVKLRDDMPRFDYSQIQSVTGFYLVEIYRPRNEIADNIYYELGQGEEIKSNVHGTPIFDNLGDTYSVTKKFTQGVDPALTTLYAVGVQRPTLYAANNDEPNDFGRPVVVDPLYQERYNYDIIRSSDIYIPQSSVNGLSSFRSEEFIRVNRAFGPVRKLILNQDVLLAVALTKIQPIYLGKDRVLNLDQNTQLGRSQLLFNLAGEVQLDLGTSHAESVLNYQGKTYGYDALQGVVWRYTSGGGQVRISDKGRVNYFKSTSDFFQLSGIEGNPVIVGVDPDQEAVFVTLAGETHVWKEGDDYWIAHYDIEPDFYASDRIAFFSFKDGVLWRHTDDAVRCNFYGVQEDCWIEFVVNQNAVLQKLFDSIEIHSEGKWYVSSARVLPNPNHPTGMASRILAAKFGYYEGAGKADFLRDETDNSKVFTDIADPLIRAATARLQGRRLRGEALIVRIQAVDPTALSTLRSVFVNYVFSETTLTP